MRVDELQGEHRSTSIVKNVLEKTDKIYIHKTAEHLCIVLIWRSRNTANNNACEGLKKECWRGERYDTAQQRVISCCFILFP